MYKQKIPQPEKKQEADSPQLCLQRAANTITNMKKAFNRNVVVSYNDCFTALLK